MMMRHLQAWILGLALLPAAITQADSTLPTAPATWQTLPLERVLDARVEAVQRATVSAQTSGRVEQVLFDVDDFVEAGDLILRLRDTEQRAGLDQAEAGLREAQARFDEARADHARIRDIFERQLVARAEMDRANAALQAAEARLEAARANRDAALEALDYTRVTAPYAGIVTERHVELGETVSPGQALMSGISLNQLRVVTQVPQRDIHAVREFRQARVQTDVGQWLEAESLTLFPYADPNAATFRVRAQLPEAEISLFPGMLVKIAFTVGQTQRLLIPESAVLTRSELAAVYVQDEQGRLSLRQIRPGYSQGEGQIEVLAGLAANERVVLDPLAAASAIRQQQESR
ncbi:RND family efflux transporter, MFP subunit [Ectothiorhodosinus mongolicus]|uniref:RND family efflux transporter, MFP subunit n=2 Tax=Ectothiorhodosinus mongolicus TaxID=233100 RepID=A0A1R3W1I4_9GAMM|nr:RND family efflux transporter, MFP subunit [Ectothiorhodosinus mongolicus]